MRKVHIDSINTGEINGKAIYTFTNRQCLLSKGVPIRLEYINRLKSLGINYIYVEDEISEGIDIQEMIPEELQVLTKACILNATLKIKNNEIPDNIKEINDAVDKIIDNMFSSSELSINLTDIRAADDYTFAHSVSVCTLALILGNAIGLNEIELRDLGIGAIMHDVGKIKIPLEILKKPDNLTKEEFEIIKTHPKEGFEILRKCETLNRNSVYVALGHHERYNGTGYPYGFTNEQIHLYARIVSIVDVFDAMSSDRVYRKGIETKKVIKYLQLMSNKHFDKKLVDRFIDKIIMYPNGSLVTLNTNEKAIVVSSNLNDQERPKVRIFSDPKGIKYKVLKEVDLSVNHEYFIIEDGNK